MRILKLFQGAGGDCARIPSIVSAPDGRVYAFANNRVATERDDAAETGILVSVRSPEGSWSPARTAAGHPGWSYMIGSAVTDRVTGRVMCLFKKIAVVDHEFHKAYSPEERRRLARLKEERDGMEEGDYVLETIDGITFTERKILIRPNPAAKGGFLLGRAGFSHGSGAGVTLKHGKYAGRILIPARFSLHEVTDWKDLRTGSSNTVIWSDDHGETFTTGGVVEPGTGEGTLAELPDGRIYYNSRAYFGDGFRRSAWSGDGGESFVSQRAARDLIEPCCNAALLSVPYQDREILLFSNPKSTADRVDMTLSASFDGGGTWQTGKCADHRKAGYSSLAFDEKSGLLFLLYECGLFSSVEEIDVAEMTVEEALES